jgi:hypothetical protein
LEEEPVEEEPAEEESVEPRRRSLRNRNEKSINDHSEDSGDSELSEDSEDSDDSEDGENMVSDMVAVIVFVNDKARHIQFAEEVGAPGDMWFYGKVGGCLGPGFVDGNDGRTQFFRVGQHPPGWDPDREDNRWRAETDNYRSPGLAHVRYEVVLDNFTLTKGHRVRQATRRLIEERSQTLQLPVTW